MFCVECGKECSIYKEGVCIDCYLKTHRFTEGPEFIDLIKCAHCGAFKIKNTWTDELLSNVINRLVKNNFKINNQLKKITINSECEEAKGGYVCNIYISGTISDKEITEKHKLNIRIDKIACDVCSKRFGGYHEAIIQIRAEGKKLTKKEERNITLFIENFVESMQNKGNRALFITDMGLVKGGIDFYISDKSAAFSIVKKIQERYGGIIKQSSKNIGMKDSKQIYRMTYLLRLLAYKKHDIMRYNDSYYIILSTHENKIKMINLKNWEESTIDIKSLKNAKILGSIEKAKDMIIVSQKKDEIQLMSPKNYNITIIRKPKDVSFEGKTIKIINLENQLFIIPPNI